MKRSTDNRRISSTRLWFWFYVFWLATLSLIFIPLIVTKPSALKIILLLVLIAIPVVINIYTVRRGRKAPAVQTPAVHKKESVCTNCGYIGHPRRMTRGRFVYEIALWLMGGLPGLIYTIWRLMNRYDICPKCKDTTMIPVDTTTGQRLVSEQQKRTEATQKDLEGQKLLETEQYDEAIKLFSEAIEIDANYAAPWLNRSEANRQLGREAEGNADREKGEALMPAVHTEAAPQRTEAEERLVIYGGFWRRVYALLNDIIIVGILSTIAAFFVGSYLMPFLIAIVYFTLGYGPPLRGRTLGKRMLGLRVIDMNGHVPNYGRAFLRSVPLAILLSTEMAEVLPQVSYPFSIPTNVLAYAIDTFVLLGLLITVIFHPQKRGIHDMLAGTLCERVVIPRSGYVEHIPQPVSPIRIGTKLRIALVGTAALALGFGIFATMPFEPEQEYPLITLWRQEGLVESAEFFSHSHQTSSGSFSTFEVRAVVPLGTLADEANSRNAQDRLMRDITFVEADILVVSLFEHKKIGFYTLNKYRWHAYPAVGKEEILEQARPQLELLLKGSESNIMYDHELSIGMSWLKHTFMLHFAMKP